MSKTVPARIKELLRRTGRSNAKLAIIPDKLFDEGMEYAAGKGSMIGYISDPRDNLLIGRTTIISVSRAEKNMEKYYQYYQAMGPFS